MIKTRQLGPRASGANHVNIGNLRVKIRRDPNSPFVRDSDATLGENGLRVSTITSKQEYTLQSYGVDNVMRIYEESLERLEGASISAIVPIVSAVAGGGTAAYLPNSDAGARTGAAAGVIGTVLTIPLLASLAAGTIAGGEAIGEPTGGALIAATVVGIGLMTMVLNAGFGALGGVLSARVTS